jgi:hypothetical protein
LRNLLFNPHPCPLPCRERGRVLVIPADEPH